MEDKVVLLDEFRYKRKINELIIHKKEIEDYLLRCGEFLKECCFHESSKKENLIQVIDKLEFKLKQVQDLICLSRVEISM